ncbi:hypothetical protein [Candidatus Reidiella endopervernicosa]|uniref:Uncharacterized protein n=1 Tax=Candidatus Reidiella endopervernicosa TaxID=2738883 RepID=A0A6N0HVH7_9GAMM|nr:hypothetical protein [Candidatus Reidiella endopervernicosa]QKQ26383.1 hypothetical protein HUE57_08890 [Candidatus Reidiella endopervernicosa]
MLLSTGVEAWQGVPNYPYMPAYRGGVVNPYPAQMGYPRWGYPNSVRGMSPWRQPWSPVNYYGPWGSMRGAVNPNGDFWVNITVSGSLSTLMNELMLYSALQGY